MQNKWPILKGNLALQLCFVALLLYTLLLPFQPFFPPITSGIIAFWLVYVLAFKKEKLSLIFKNNYAILWIGYYLILLVGLLYTNNPAEAGKDVVLKISLILWPLGFASWPEPIVKNKISILSVFAWSTVASAFAVSVAGFALWQESSTPASQLYVYTNVWKAIPNHYMALYANFSIFILAHLYITKKQRLLYTIFGISMLVVLIAVTSVRIQFLALPAAVLVFLFLQKVDAARKKRFITFAAIGLLVVIGLAILMPSSRNRMLETADELRSVNGMVANKQTNHRVFLWHYGSEVIAENFWIGTGTGAADFALAEKLKECDAQFWDGKRNYTLQSKLYNFHNEFLQQFATHGIVGFLLILALMAFPILNRKKPIGALEGAFLTLICISFFTESMLERQAGVLFFGFFYALFFVAPFAASADENS